MAGGSRRLFIYYRVAAPDRESAVRAAQAAQRSLCQQFAGLHAQLLQRPQATPGADLTLMETYAMDAQARPEGIDAGLEAGIEAAMRIALAPWVAADARHVEVFVDLDPACAS